MIGFVGRELRVRVECRTAALCEELERRRAEWHREGGVDVFKPGIDVAQEPDEARLCTQADVAISAAQREHVDRLIFWHCETRKSAGHGQVLGPLKRAPCRP